MKTRILKNIILIFIGTLVGFGFCYVLLVMPTRRNAADELMISALSDLKALELSLRDAKSPNDLLRQSLIDDVKVLAEEYPNHPGIPKLVGRVKILFDATNQKPSTQILAIIDKFREKPGFGEPGNPELYHE
jgi:hypothetical protein